jgi:hypothetical protein
MVDPARVHIQETPHLNTQIGLPIADPLLQAEATFSAQRLQIFEMIRTRPWYNNSSAEMKLALAQLPDQDQAHSYNGFLADLAARPDQISNLTVQRLVKLAHGNSTVIPIFAVTNENGMPFTYEYVSNCIGPVSRAKGLVLIEKHGEITHFALTHNEQFSTGKLEAGTFGCSINSQTDTLETITDRYENSVCEQLGIRKELLSLSSVYLGQPAIDPGMTNERVTLILSRVDASALSELQLRSDTKDLSIKSTGPSIYPIDQIWEVMAQSRDSFAQLTFMKAFARGMLNIPEPKAQTSMVESSIVTDTGSNGLTLRSSREDIFNMLETRQWYKNTDALVKQQLRDLPSDPKNDYTGFLADLANRPEQIGGYTQTQLLKIERGNFAILPVFEVRDTSGNLTQREYVSWRFGPASGAKGLILFEKDGEPTHFAYRTAHRFATGQIEDDSIGGFIDLNLEGVQSLVDRIKVEAQEELGLEKVKLIAPPIILGDHPIDSERTNNRPALYQASIDAAEARNIDSQPCNLDSKEVKGTVVFEPMSRLWNTLADSGDTYLVSSVLQSYASGQLKVSHPRN